MNFYFNSNLDNLPIAEGGSLVSVDINGGNVRDLFSSDEFLCSLLLQDPRFMMLDAFAPKVPIIGNIPLPVDFGLNLRLGNIVAIGCYASTGDLNIFQQRDFRSSYTTNNMSTTDDISYHHGDIMADVLGGITLFDQTEFSRAINTPLLPSSLSQPNMLNPFSYSDNLLHNFTVVESTLASAYGAIDPSNYIDETVVGSE
jgi:hypothetical protein